MMISKDVSWMDEGFYTCMAGNTIGETVSQVNLPKVARAISIFKNEQNISHTKVWYWKVIVMTSIPSKPYQTSDHDSLHEIGTWITIVFSSIFKSVKYNHNKFQAYLHISSASRCLPVGLIITSLLLTPMLTRLHNWDEWKCQLPQLLKCNCDASWFSMIAFLQNGSEWTLSLAQCKL